MFDFVVRKLLVEQPIDQMLLDLLDWLLDHEVFDLNQFLLKWCQNNLVKVEKKYKKTHHQNRSSFGWMDSSIGVLVSYRVLNVSLLKNSIKRYPVMDLDEISWDFTYRFLQDFFACPNKLFLDSCFDLNIKICIRVQRTNDEKTCI